MPSENPSLRVDQVVRRLQEAIADELQFDDRLPSEVDLASEYGVSRATIREAMKVLAGRGLISLGRGRRATVKRPSSELLGDHLSAMTRRDPARLLELMSVHDNLGIYVAELAASSHTAARDTALSVAEQACARMEAAPDIHQFRVANVEFHHALVAASGNEMLSFILEAMDAALGSTVSSAYQGQLSLGELPDSGSVAIHRDLLDAVRDRRVEDARRCALEHARRVRSGAHQRIATVMAGGSDPGEAVRQPPSP